MTAGAPDDGVALLGHLQATVGLGTAARGMAAAMAAAQVAASRFDLDHIAQHGLPTELAPPARHAINLLHTNPDLLLDIIGNRHGADFGRVFDRRFNIGCWAWESPTTLPETWLKFLPLFDEVWMPSAFSAQALAARLPFPVLTMPHVVEVTAPTIGRAALGLPATGFLFLSVFDELSNLARKNPLGSVLAFRRAFPSPGTAILVLKARTLSDENRRALLAAIDSRPDIQLTVGDIPPAGMASLLAAADAVVSLHRAEGFGLALAEAMYLGKPVIATGYSGNLDFMRPGNSLAVRHRLVTLDRAEGVFPAGTVWADPDLGHAARLMRLLAASPRRAQALGQQAALDMRAGYSAKAVGVRVGQRLDTIRRYWKAPPRREISIQR